MMTEVPKPKPIPSKIMRPQKQISSEPAKTQPDDHIVEPITKITLSDSSEGNTFREYKKKSQEKVKKINGTIFCLASLSLIYNGY